jgi:CRP-like cAMP-binding protein
MLRPPSANNAFVILEAGDYIPIIDNDSAFKLSNDGAIDIEHFTLSLEHFELLQTGQAIFIELFAAQIPQQERFTPDVKFFKAKDIILNKDESGNTLHTLVEGHACAEIEGVVVGEISSGESFGVVAALTNGKRSADVRASSNCMVMSVPADSLETMIKHNPHLSLNIMKSLAKNLLQANQKAVKKHEN